MKFFSYLLVAVASFCLALYLVNVTSENKGAYDFTAENPIPVQEQSTKFTTYYEQLDDFQKSLYNVTLKAVEIADPEVKITNIDVASFFISVKYRRAVCMEFAIIINHGADCLFCSVNTIVRSDYEVVFRLISSVILKDNVIKGKVNHSISNGMIGTVTKVNERSPVIVARSLNHSTVLKCYVSVCRCLSKVNIKNVFICDG